MGMPRARAREDWQAVPMDACELEGDRPRKAPSLNN